MLGKISYFPNAENSKARRDQRGLVPETQLLNIIVSFITRLNQVTNLIKDNLEAYHNALAFAVNQWALNN